MNVRSALAAVWILLPASLARAQEAAPKIVTEVGKNWFPAVESRLAVPGPAGYIVPAAQANAVRTLLDHGVRVYRFSNGCSGEHGIL